jgi:hypothetical protein
MDQKRFEHLARGATFRSPRHSGVREYASTNRFTIQRWRLSAVLVSSIHRGRSPTKSRPTVTHARLRRHAPWTPPGASAQRLAAYCRVTGGRSL